MSKFKKQDLLYLLKLEMGMIQGGGYGRSVLLSWRDVKLVRDCVTCLNILDAENDHQCHDCFLLEHVPELHKQEKVPCHFIPLNNNGETVAELNRQGRRTDAQAALLDWIGATIRKIEAEPD